MNTQPNREKQIDRLLHKAEQLRTEDNKGGIKAAQSALDLARGSTPDEQILPEKLAEGLYVLGSLQGEAFEQDLALTALFEALSIFLQLGNTSRQADTLMAISQVYHRCHDEDLALEYASRALRSFETLRNREKEASALATLGSMYLKSGFLSVAMNHFNKASSLAHELSLRKLEAEALEQMAMISLQQNEYFAALGHSLKSLEIQQKNHNITGQARLLLLMGKVHQKLNALEDAHDCLVQGSRLAREAGEPKLQVLAHLRMGEYSQAAGDTSSAVQQLEQALALAEKLEDARSNRELNEIHAMLANIFEQAGNPEKALFHLRQAHEIEKQRLEDDFQSRLKGQEVSHRMETARKEAEIYELRNVELRQEIKERQQIQAELEKATIFDELTRAYNRRHWIDLTQRELDRAARYQQPLSLILLDVERLRNINERYGRAAGEHTLITLAAFCNEALRKPDILARYGEDEFIILLPQTSLKGAKTLAERLREDIEEKQIHYGQQEIPVQVSLGTAGLEPNERVSLETLLDQATHSLYQEKTARRDLRA